MDFNEIGNPKYIALETFKKNGEGVNTPVWVTPVDGKLYVWTGADSWKVKRIRNNPHVRIAVSDARGNPKSDWVDARAAVLNSQEDVQAQKARIAAKYGLMFRMIQFMEKVRGSHGSRTVVAVGPAEG